MADEKYCFIQETKEKKTISRCARNKRTHCGKGGRVRFPADHLTKKEREALNGEITTYRLKEPMSWAEYKKMPDDLRVFYLRELDNYNPLQNDVAKMFGVSQATVSRELKRLDIGLGQRGPFDREGWKAFTGEVNDPASEQNSPPTGQQTEQIAARAIEGSLTIEGDAEDAIRAAVNFIPRYGRLKISVSWQTVSSGEGEGL